MNKKATILTAFLIAAVFAGIIHPAQALTSVLPASPCGSYGDINNDGYVTESDSKIVANYVAYPGNQNYTLTDAQIARADVTGNGAVNIGDALAIANYAIRNLSTFAACSMLKQSPCNKYGDINDDGYVTKEDSLLVAKYVSYPGSTAYALTDIQKARADVTGNGAVNIGDALAIANYASGNLSTFNVCTTNITRVSTPRFEPPAGIYPASPVPLSIIISTSTTGATIRYTLDGTEPIDTGMESPAYLAPIKITSTKTIKAKAFKTGMAPSATASAAYTILTPGTAPTLQLTLKPGWNQISSPVAAGIDLYVIEQYCNISAYKSRKIMSWNATSSGWAYPSRVEPFRGYWIYATAQCAIPLSGTPAAFSTLQLYKGWNKISAQGNFSAIQGTCAGHIIGNWIWNWDKATNKWLHPTTMQAERGYWIAVDQNCVLGSGQSPAQ